MFENTHTNFIKFFQASENKIFVSTVFLSDISVAGVVGTEMVCLIYQSLALKGLNKCASIVTGF